MKAIFFYIFYAIIWVISLLPLRVLYLLSDILYLFVYHIVKYRRKVVAMNLANSFPDKSDKERKEIEKKFYRNLCDLFIESMKSIHFSDKQLMKHMHMENPEVFEELYEENKDAFIVLGHHCNWEWLTAIPLNMKKHKPVSIYKPLADKYFDRLMINLRSSTGATMVPTAMVIREIIKNRNSNRRTLYMSILDQTPPKEKITYWTTFLNQDTPVITGTEKLAIKFGMPVYFLSIHKIKRGYYNFAVEPLFEETKGLEQFVITEAFTRRLEALIISQPECYLWSHRRWKHKRVKEG
ncbi:MAG: lysophospholipid acyltransferase family protein [Bacteroidales bacterium]|nr:lysophospholipid acyltransferase family protein [Bacteroidales bacterium]